MVTTQLGGKMSYWQLNVGKNALSCIQIGKYSKITSKELFTFSTDQVDTWKSAIGLLQQHLKQKARRAEHLSISLSHAWTRFFTIPWSDDLLDKQKARSYLTAHFSSIYGDLDDLWEFTFEKREYGAPQIACALKQEWLAQLIELSQHCNCQLHSIAPWSIQAFNHYRLNIGASDAWFAAIEPGFIALSAIRAARVDRIVLHRYESQTWETELKRLIRRQNLCESREQPLPVYWISLIKPDGNVMPEEFHQLNTDAAMAMSDDADQLNYSLAMQ